jgi:isopenicillin N synthase-like dioxygenase
MTSPESTRQIPLVVLPDEQTLLSGEVSPELLTQIDETLRTSGFLLLEGHGISEELTDSVRRYAFEVFRLPEAQKRELYAGLGGRGWVPYGEEANSGTEGVVTPPDRKESYTFGAQTPIGDAAIDALWFAPNLWPPSVPEMKAALEEWTELAHAAADRLLMLMALSIGEPVDLFTRHCERPTWTMNLNWYPALTESHATHDGQFRIGAHTDFGTLTLLDRQTGMGGLQVDLPGEGWVDVPYVPGALTINIGDLLARWTGDRWRSTRHRVLPPHADAPAEELLSLVFFYEVDADTLVETLPAPISERTYPPVVATDYLAAQFAAIAVNGS